MAEILDRAHPFLAAHQRLLRDLQEATCDTDVHRSVHEAGREYAKVLHSPEAPPEVQQRLREAWEELARASRAQGVRDADAAEPAPDQAYEGYAAALREAHGQRQKQVRVAYRRYLDSLREAPKAMVTSVTSAFDDYVQAVKEAWAQLDPQGIPPATLVAIGQSIAAAAGAYGTTVSGLHQSVAATELIPRDYLSEEAS